jgi:hypothetical protein
MAARFKLGSYETVRDDPLGRSHVGFFPRMTEEEAWDAGRGVWRMSAGKAAREKFGDRIELQGHVLGEGHPVRDAYLGKPDPVGTGSQNPVGYCDLPEEKQFILSPCHCGCGLDTDRDFLPGHDVRAMQARVRQHFGGSPLKFIQWVDDQLAGPAPKEEGQEQ